MFTIGVSPHDINRRPSHTGRRSYRNRRRHSFVPVEVDVVAADQATGLGSNRKVTGELGQPRPPRWVVPLFGLGALVLVPWVALLVVVLPSAHRAAHWDVAWAGFDVALALLLLAVAAAAWRRSPWFEGAATAAATLLFFHAWFYMLTSPPQTALVVSLVKAAFIEVPLASGLIGQSRALLVQGSYAVSPNRPKPPFVARRVPACPDDELAFATWVDP